MGGGDPVKAVLRIVRVILWGFLAMSGVGAALFGYFVYTPAVEIPPLTGTFKKDSIVVNRLTRTYWTYAPRGLVRGAPLVIVMHGSGENGVQMRLETGYAFDRLADEHHFAVVYPDALAHGGDWNACGTVGDDSADGSGIDDVRFLTDVVDRLVTEIGTDPSRTFAAGGSRGGFMAFRLALEAPARFRAVAAVSANVHTSDNFKCKPSPSGTSSVMIINGTEDPLVPFDGGEVNLLGFSYKYGNVMSSRQSAQHFGDLNHLAGAGETTETLVAEGIRVEQVLWRDDSREVELVAVHGGGHGMPQPYRRHPRLLGPSPKEPNAPEMIWAFFERQRP